MSTSSSACIFRASQRIDDEGPRLHDEPAETRQQGTCGEVAERLKAAVC